MSFRAMRRRGASASSRSLTLPATWVIATKLVRKLKTYAFKIELTLWHRLTSSQQRVRACTPEKVPPCLRLDGDEVSRMLRLKTRFQLFFVDLAPEPRDLIPHARAFFGSAHE